MSWAQERIDGFREAVADFGATITVGGVPLGVVELTPEAMLALQNAGFEDESTCGFQILRSDFDAAALGYEARFAVSGIASIAAGTVCRVTRVAGPSADPVTTFMAAVV